MTHPIAGACPTTRPEGLVVPRRTGTDSYVEEDDDGTVTYAEHHRTHRRLGAHPEPGTASGSSDLIEPEWPQGHDRVWGGWGPVRGALIPGTAIFSADLA